ncbi:Hpt domain-containing protein [uncultured Mailhella sp.]|uniref:Hpt domain-containing protein n=1 Tax=uncultured Mailhella sp. TaxID=1981031 RepID=UPI00320ACB6F
MDANVRNMLIEGGINVDEVLERCMGSEALVARLLKKFPADGSYGKLSEAVDNGDEAAALEASHTLKGVCGNLAVSELFGLLDRQVQLLRAHDMDGAAAVMPEITRTYQAAVQAVEKAFS